MVKPKTAEEIELLRINGDLVSRTLAEVGKAVAPGVTTLELDRLAETFIRDHGAVPSFKGFDGFPNALCMSVNDVVVHGFPSDYVLKEGDIVSVDCGTFYKGYNGDSAYTFPVGKCRRRPGSSWMLPRRPCTKAWSRRSTAIAAAISDTRCNRTRSHSASPW